MNPDEQENITYKVSANHMGLKSETNHLLTDYVNFFPMKPNCERGLWGPRFLICLLPASEAHGEDSTWLNVKTVSNS